VLPRQASKETRRTWLVLPAAAQGDAIEWVGDAAFCPLPRALPDPLSWRGNSAIAAAKRRLKNLDRGGLSSVILFDLAC